MQITAPTIAKYCSSLVQVESAILSTPYLGEMKLVHVYHRYIATSGWRKLDIKQVFNYCRLRSVSDRSWQIAYFKLQINLYSESDYCREPTKEMLHRRSRSMEESFPCLQDEETRSYIFDAVRK